MKKDNLVQRLGKKVLPYFLAGSLSLTSLLNYKCSVTEPEEPKKPVAVLKAEPTEGYVPLSVNFDGSQSYALEGYIQEYLWDFGDGKTDTTTQAFTNYLYEEGGQYNAGLVVVDNKGQKSNKALERILVNDDIVSLGEIAFYSDRDPPGADIFSGEIVSRNNEIILRNEKNLTLNNVPQQDTRPRWSPDGQLIAFQTNRDTVFSTYVMNPDGTNLRKILNPTDPELRTMNPNWSPDGEKIIFTYYNASVAGIGYVNSNDIGGSTFISIYEEPGVSSLPRGPPSYSPDGEKIVFYRTGDEEIYLMDADGSNLENLTNHPARDIEPMFLPDGRILFISDRANPNQIPIQHDVWLMNSDGSNPIRLTFEPGVEVDPMISRDGKYLLFTHDIDMYNPQIYITEFTDAWDRTQWTQLTTEGANRFSTWKPKINN